MHRTEDADEAEADSISLQVARSRRIDLFVSLLEEILQANKEILVMEIVGAAQISIKRKHPVLADLHFTRDLRVTHDLPDTRESCLAVGALLKRVRDIIADLLGKSWAEKGFGTTAERFVEKNKAALATVELDGLWPEILPVPDASA